MAYVTDNFQRPNGALGGAWSTPTIPSGGVGTGSIQIFNNGFAPTSSAACNMCMSVWQGTSFGNDQWAQASLVNTPTNKSIVAITACTSAAGTSTFTYTLTSGASLFTGQQIYIAGMTNSGNNTTVGRIITGLGAGTFSVANASPGANESGSTGTGTGPGDCFPGLVVRGTADGQNGYFTYTGTNSGAFASNGISADQRVYQQEIWKVVAGTFTFLIGTAASSLLSIPDVSGTVYRLAAVGTTISLYRNGVKILSATDSSLTSGTPGIQAGSCNGTGEFAHPTAYTTGGDNSIQLTNFFAGDTPGQLASDNFTRANGGLGANWTTNPTEAAPQIASNLAEGQTLDTRNGAFYNATSFPNDQFSEVTVATFANANSLIQTKVRQSASAETSYFFNAKGPIGSSAQFSLFKLVAGVQTQLGSTLTSQTVSAGDILRISVVGTTVTAYHNGFQVIQVTDAAVASGSGAFTLQPNTAVTASQISLWAGGSIVSPTPPNTGTGWSPVDSRQAVKGFGPAANTGIVDAQGNVIYSAQKPPFTGNSQVSDNAAIPPTDSRKAGAPVDSRKNVPVNSRVAPPFKS